MLIVLLCLLGVLENDVDLVLENYHMVQLHYLESHQVLDCLGLRAIGVGCDQQQGSIHHSCSCKHGRKEDLVAWAVAEGNVALQFQSRAASFVVADWVVFFVGREGFEAVGGGADWAFIDLGVGIS